MNTLSANKAWRRWRRRKNNLVESNDELAHCWKFYILVVIMFGGPMVGSAIVIKVVYILA